MTAYATLVDFETRLGRDLAVGDVDRVEILLADASALVDEAAGIAFTTVPAVIVPLVCEVARRAFDNPAGLQGETIGDYTWRGGKTGSGVYLTGSERAIVRRAAGKLGVGTVGLQGDLPLAPFDPRLGVYLTGTGDLEGVVLVNAPEPVDL